ncbi:hypothetical protein VTJ04DRAFT_6585 [Mycothermus thermophilus]|uniref:uncharacterized protein n=1 Tax=Humicola insolens TaxID=85995 RepID=UPI003743D285
MPPKQKKTTVTPKNPNYNNLEAFHARLRRSRRILAVCGAGLSAASGLPTFRGAGGWWRNYEATKLATPEAWRADPGLVWGFYGYRRHMALRVEPNAGHYVLAELARQNPDFLCVSQNVDNLHARANHPPSQLRLLHGNLFTLKCESRGCDYSEYNTESPLCPALAAVAVDPPSDPSVLHPVLDPSHPLPSPPRSDLPHCPTCTSKGKSSLLRPGVVWFGESLDPSILSYVDDWIASPSTPPVDMVLVIGTSGIVYPAAGLAEMAKSSSNVKLKRLGWQTKGENGGGNNDDGEEEKEVVGCSVVHVNLDAEDPETLRGLGKEDFAFAGDAAEVLPRLLEPVVGRWVEERREFVKG